LADGIQWRDKITPFFEPKSAMGEALRYLRNQWARLTAFLSDARIPLHNNASEAALRIVALARKNTLFFGHEEAGRRFMVLYSLIATCERHDVNPEVYLADVLLRIQGYPLIDWPNSFPIAGRNRSDPDSPSRESSRPAMRPDRSPALRQPRSARERHELLSVRNGRGRPRRALPGLAVPDGYATTRLGAQRRAGSRSPMGYLLTF
jgi:hypothetical protein